jgi:hypothetical protein
MPEIKKNWSLWLAVALPFAMILFVTGSIYLPKLWAPEPQYGFVYSDDEYYAPSIFRVVNGRLEKRPMRTPDEEKYTDPQLYYYDARTKESRDISFEEASALMLDNRSTSPDGFVVKRGGGYGGPFGGSYEAGVYLTGHAVSHKLDLRGIESAYNFSFIGWVVETGE